MTIFASCNGLPVVGGTLLMPLVGAWTADLYLATQQPVTGAVSVVLGNLTIHGTVYRSEPYGGQVRARLVAGAGGWRTTVPSQGYGSGSGVRLSHVLGDVASACGESVNVPVDAAIGPGFARAEGPASDVLWQLVAQGAIPAWYVDTAGVTQAAAWPGGTIQTPFDVTDQQPETGHVTIATEDYASWVPGVSFAAPQLQGSYTSAGVEYLFDNDGTFRLHVLTGSTDRFLGALAAFVDRKLAPTRYYGRYEYTISNPTTTTIDGTPTDPSMPELQGVPLTSDAISSYTPPDGGLAHVQFVNGWPTRPTCVWTSSPPTNAAILDGTNPAAKLGDTVQSMISGQVTVIAAALTLASSTVGPLGAVTGTGVLTLQGLSPISGTITTGSAAVQVPN